MKLTRDTLDRIIAMRNQGLMVKQIAAELGATVSKISRTLAPLVLLGIVPAAIGPSPIQRRIATLMREKQRTADIARAVGMSWQNADYHVRKIRERGWIDQENAPRA